MIFCSCKQFFITLYTLTYPVRYSVYEPVYAKPSTQLYMYYILFPEYVCIPADSAYLYINISKCWICVVVCCCILFNRTK